MAIEAPEQTVQRRVHEAIVRRYLDAWSALDIAAIETTLHPDVELELGYVPAGVPTHVTGRANVVEFLRDVPTVVAPMNFHSIEISTLEDPAELVAQYRGDSRALSTDRPYRNRYVARARIEEGLIRRYLEFSDPLIFLEAFVAAEPTSSDSLTPADRIEIHELLARRGFASDTADVPGWVATFTEDGVLEQPQVELDLPSGAEEMTPTVSGADELTAFLTAAVPNLTSMRHVITNITTDPTEGGAIARSAFHVLDTGRQVTVVTGRYTDTLRRTDGGWKTSHLKVEMDG